MIRIIFSRLWILGMAMIVAMMFIVGFFMSSTANAENVPSSLLWTGSKPVVYSSNQISSMAPGLCSGFYQSKAIDGYWDLKNICMTSGSTVRVGVYFADYAYRAAVGFKFDTKMYKVNGVCGQYDNCLYLPGTDTMVTKQYLINGLVRSLVVYKNFTRRLIPVINGSVISTLEYDFDSSNPDYIFQNADNYAWPIGGFGASNNGRWLAVEFRQRGIGLLDINTLQMKRISTLTFNYGMGMDPISEIAVSNNGNHVAVVGVNAGLSVFDVNSECGDEASDERMSSVTPIANSCRVSQINSEEFIYRFSYAVQPRFDDEGGELGFYAIPYVGDIRQVTLRASGYVGQRLDYLALGDSFTSGEGETDDSYYLNGTNDEYEKCHISVRSYPYLIASLSNIDPVYMRSVACSGANTDDIVGDDVLYAGQGDRLGKFGLNLNEIDTILAKNIAKYSFVSGRVYQQTFVDKYKPKVITVGIGGNDVGFINKLKACLMPGTCSWASTDEGKEQTAVEIKTLFDTLVATYKEIHIGSPESKIYAIGYPKIIDEDGDCDLIVGVLLDATEKTFMNQAIIYLNQVIEAAAKSAGIKYIDIQESYGSHVLCGQGQPSAMNAIMLGDDRNLVNNSQWFRFIGNESFHPNPLGHNYAANSIYDSVGNILTYNYCENGITSCPDKTVTAPEPSAYWLADGYHNYAIQKYSTFVYDQEGSTNGLERILVLDSGSLDPNSLVESEVHSDVFSLGQFEASNDGSLYASVSLPSDLTEGYHTVHLYGISYSGELIDLYQVIEYRKPHVATVVELDAVSTVFGVVDDTSKILATNISNVNTSVTPIVAIKNVDSVVVGQQEPLVDVADTQMVKGVSIGEREHSFALVVDDGANRFNDLTYYIIVGLFVTVAGLVWVKFRH